MEKVFFHINFSGIAENVKLLLFILKNL